MKSCHKEEEEEEEEEKEEGGGVWGGLKLKYYIKVSIPKITKILKSLNQQIYIYTHTE